jgi:homoserine kinase
VSGGTSAADRPARPGTASVRVPASTSNLGAGFDCVGLALDRWLRASAAVGVHDRVDPLVERAGTLATLDGLPPADDLLVRGFAAACGAAGRALPAGVAIRAASEIPVARGLGSSAAALVAGGLLADALLGLGLGRHGVAAVCADVEGHSDNAAAACLGGTVLGVPRPGGGGSPSGAWTLAPLDLHPGVALAFAVPAFGASTAAMRRALPSEVAHRDAVHAAGKAAALVRGLAAADGDLLAWALDDLLHVPYRRALLPGYDAVCAAALAAGAWGVTLSGAGSSIVALAAPERAAAAAGAMTAAWRAIGVAADAWTPRVAAGAAYDTDDRVSPPARLEPGPAVPVPAATGRSATG